MNTKRWMTTLLVTLLAATALAGCAAPEETGEEPLGDDVQEDAGTDENQTADGNQTTAETEQIAIDGFLYECDTTAELDNDAGTCDEYQNTGEEADETFEGQSFQSNEDGTVVIDGRTYTCDDDLETQDQPCDEYVLEAEE